MSGAPGAGTYRVSIKHEKRRGQHVPPQSRYRWRHFRCERAERKFHAAAGDEPVVLLSAGIGATPVLAMLHALQSAASQREVWWLYGARNRNDHPFAKESRQFLKG